jgi:hypothetical protein
MLGGQSDRRVSRVGFVTGDNRVDFDGNRSYRFGPVVDYDRLSRKSDIGNQVTGRLRPVTDRSQAYSGNRSYRKHR